jgi:hypothetical protein
MVSIFRFILFPKDAIQRYSIIANYNELEKEIASALIVTLYIHDILQKLAISYLNSQCISRRGIGVALTKNSNGVKAQPYSNHNPTNLLCFNYLTSQFVIKIGL